MILTREISIKINSVNYSYYDDLGYEPMLGETLKIPVEILSSGSHQKIECQCDGCGIIKEIIFKNYLKYNNNWGYYTCRKCSEEKRKQSLRKKHGVDYPIQKKEFRDKVNSYKFDLVSFVNTEKFMD